MIRVEMLATAILIQTVDSKDKYNSTTIRRTNAVFAGWHNRIVETVDLHIYAGFLMSLLIDSEIKPLLIANGEMSNYDAFLLSITHRYNNG